MNIIFGDEVRLDIQDAFEWYESKRDGLGEEFLLALYIAIQQVQFNPYMFAEKYHQFRICLLSKFPFGIHFIIKNELVYVTGVYHTSRSSKHWLKRL